MPANFKQFNVKNQGRPSLQCRPFWLGPLFRNTSLDIGTHHEHFAWLGTKVPEDEVITVLLILARKELGLPFQLTGFDDVFHDRPSWNCPPKGGSVTLCQSESSSLVLL